MNEIEKIKQMFRDVGERFVPNDDWCAIIATYGAIRAAEAAEAMREAAAKALIFDNAPPVMARQFAAIIRALPLPPAAEVASPAAGWRPIEEADPNREYLLHFPEVKPRQAGRIGHSEMRKWGRPNDALVRRPTMFLEPPEVPSSSEEARAG